MIDYQSFNFTKLQIYGDFKLMNKLWILISDHFGLNDIKIYIL